MNIREKILAAAAFGLMIGPAVAQDYPSMPITVINQYSPGGGGDITARALIGAIGDSIPQPIAVDYKTGAGGMIAAAALESADPDGYTLLIDTLQLSNNPLMRTVAYDHEAFEPISLFSMIPLALLVPNDLPVENVQELVDYAKAHPGELNYGTLGPGGTSHLAAELFKAVAGIEMEGIAYQGTPAIHQEIMGGTIQVFFDGLSQALPAQKAGNMRILAVTTEERLESAPDLPTMTEQGFPVVGGGWFGLVAPAGTPEEVTAYLSEKVQAAVASEGYQTRMAELGAVPVAGSPSDFAAFRKADREKWQKILEPLDLKLE